MEIIHAGLRGMFDLLKNVIAIQHRIPEVDLDTAIRIFLQPGRGRDYSSLILYQSRVSRRGKYFFLNSRTVHLPSEDVSGRDCWFVAQNRRVSRFSAGLHLYQCMLEVGFV